MSDYWALRWSDFMPNHDGALSPLQEGNQNSSKHKQDSNLERIGTKNNPSVSTELNERRKKARKNP